MTCRLLLVLSVTVEKNFGDLADIELLTREDWAATGRLAREYIVRHTTGTDQSGKAFAPYSKGYAKARQKAGLSTRPSLQLSGAMLQSITVEPDANGVTLGFSR